MTNRSTMLSDIDRAVVLGAAGYPELKAYREYLRGGASEGDGENIISGPVPRFDRDNNCYTVEGRSSPSLFISDTGASFDEECRLVYSVELTAVLPSMVLGKLLSIGQIEDFAGHLARALHVGRTVHGYSIGDQLSSVGLSSVLNEYRVMRLFVAGTDQQQRVVSQIQFRIPSRELFVR